MPAAFDPADPSSAWLVCAPPGCLVAKIICLCDFYHQTGRIDCLPLVHDLITQTNE